MEIIRNYLENMFANLPLTPEVVRAKNELWQMMEDKYTELKAEGKSENEAVGIVITEFGNLDELSEDLGIRSFVKTENIQNRRTVTMEETRAYMKAATKRAFTISLGVFLCIISPIVMILTDISGIISVLPAVFFFLCITAAVALFVYPAITMQRWNFLKRQPCTIDFATARYVQEQKEHYRTNYALLLTIGIALCILSVVPTMVVSEMGINLFWIAGIAPSLFLLTVGIGVFLIVLANLVNASYGTLLKLNDASTISGSFAPSGKQETDYGNPTRNAVMSVFWPTVTCIYLSWSFISFDWHFTWIIWPIAAVVFSLLKALFADK